MRMGSNLHLKNQAISLRREGKSYNDIIKELGIKSKGTLSLWFKDLILSDESQKILEKNQKLAHDRGLFTANEQRGKKITEENKKAFSEGLQLITEMSSN